MEAEAVRPGDDEPVGDAEVAPVVAVGRHRAEAPPGDVDDADAVVGDDDEDLRRRVAREDAADRAERAAAEPRQAARLERREVAVDRREHAFADE